MHKCLAVRHTPGSHTAKLLAQHTTEILHEFGVVLDNGVHIITDNAANVRLAMTKVMTNVKWRPCFAHSLQLVINSSVDSPEVAGLSKMLAKASAIVGHFRHSPSATTALMTIQADNKLPQHKLVQDVATRWNSQVINVLLIYSV